jgi:hypothetical protein
MSTFTYNTRTDLYEAMDGGHSIYIADDVFMTELQLLQENEGMTDGEAFDELDDLGWWYNRLPLAGVFIDGIEQTGTEEFSLRAKERMSQD